MKYTVMKCDCCGKEFYSEYYEGGYIDHVENFVGNRHVYVYRNDVKDMAREIIFHGNDLRQTIYIKEFLKCFMTWDCFSEEFKNNVKDIVIAMLDKIKKAEARAEVIRKREFPFVIAMLKREKIDDAYFDAFDECCGETDEEEE